MRAEAGAGRSGRERERPRRWCRRRRRGVGPSPSGRSLLSCFALSLRPSGLVRLTRILEVGLVWAECLESPFGNQNAYDFREFVHFLQKIYYLVHGGTLEAHVLRALMYCRLIN